MYYFFLVPLINMKLSIGTLWFFNIDFTLTMLFVGIKWLENLV